MNLDKIFLFAVKKGASDVHIASGMKPFIRVDGELIELNRVEAISHNKLRRFLDELLSPAGIKYFSFQIGSLALINSLLPIKQTKNNKVNFSDSIMVLDFGASKSLIVVSNNYEFQFSTIIDVSGVLIVDKISKEKKIPKKSAMKRKRECTPGDGTCMIENRIIEKELKVITDNINRVIQSFETQFDTKIKYLFLSGGESLMLSVKPYLKLKTGLEVINANPLCNLNYRSKQKMDPHPLIYSTAIGLALSHY